MHNVEYIKYYMYVYQIHDCVQFMSIKKCQLSIFVSFLEVKGIVSRYFGGLQMIFMDRIVVPDIPMEVYFFASFLFHIVI